jgi:hypothetical protein
LACFSIYKFQNQNPDILQHREILSYSKPTSQIKPRLSNDCGGDRSLSTVDLVRHSEVKLALREPCAADQLIALRISAGRRCFNPRNRVGTELSVLIPAQFGDFAGQPSLV